MVVKIQHLCVDLATKYGDLFVPEYLQLYVVSTGVSKFHYVPHPSPLFLP